MEDLLNALSNYLLQSGFQDSWYFYEFNEGEQTLEQLRQAIQQALESGDMLDENMREQLEQMRADGQLDELIEKLIDRMEQENYITVDQPFDRSQQSNLPGQTGEMQQGQVKFEVTDKGLDFLGYRALRDLLGSLGKSNFGRHDTRDMATGIESSGASSSLPPHYQTQFSAMDLKFHLNSNIRTFRCISANISLRARLC